MSLPRATSVAHGGDASDRVSLDYEARMLRRRRLVTEGGVAFLVGWLALLYAAWQLKQS